MVRDRRFTAKVTIDYLLIGNRTQFSTDATFDDLEEHLKVISMIHRIFAIFGRLSRRAVSK